MFVKIFRYNIRKKDLAKWKKIVKAADIIYKKYGEEQWIPLIRKENKVVTVVEVAVYKSRKSFEEIQKNTRKDKEIDMLFEELLKLVNNSKISEEEFETA